MGERKGKRETHATEYLREKGLKPLWSEREHLEDRKKKGGGQEHKTGRKMVRGRAPKSQTGKQFKRNFSVYNN